MLDWNATYQLSRFALLRRGPGGFILETPLSNRQFKVARSVLRLLESLATPVQLRQFLEAAPADRRAALREFLIACDEGAFLTRIREDGSAEEDEAPLANWEFHDLFFHARTRYGRCLQPVGATYHGNPDAPHEPAIRTDYPCTSWREIPRQAPNSGNQSNGALQNALEKRRSVRGGGPVDLATLGEFLYRTFRVTRLPSGHDDAIRKVYPSGGSLHPLELYVVASAVRGLDPGIYLYQPVRHALGTVRGMDDEVSHLLADASRSAGEAQLQPAILLVIAARFGRTMWKYESVAYRLILLEVGTVFQTLYLVATAMGLRGCALGTGDSDRFSRLVHTGYYAETSVGEFILGGAPAEPSEP